MTTTRRANGLAGAAVVALSVLAIAGCSGPTAADAPAEPPMPPTIEAPDVEWGGPLTITRGGTYTGAWESTDPEVPAVEIATSEPVTLSGCALRGPGTLVHSEYVASDLTVTGCYAEGRPTGTSDPRFVAADSDFRRLVVEGNDAVATTGIWMNAPEPDAEIRVVANRFRHAARNDYLLGYVQLSGVVSGNVEIAWNEIVNEPDASQVIDNISVFASGGRPGAPIRIHDNFVWGAYPLPSTEAEFAGGGIMVGDQGSSTGHVVVEGNQVVGTTNYGIAIVCGSDQVARDNVVVSSGRTADGTWLPSTNVGLVMADESLWGADCTTYERNTFTANRVGWVRGPGNRFGPGRADSDAPSAGGSNTITATTAWPTTPTYDDEVAQWAAWLEKTSGRSIGRQPADTDTTTG